MVNLIVKHSGSVRRLAYRRDTFQTFIFRSLALCGFIILSAWSVLVQRSNQGSGCVGIKFTIAGHYSNSAWMEQMYNEFREQIEDDPDLANEKICYKLVIGEDRLTENLRPTIWNPQHSLWDDGAKIAIPGYQSTCNDTSSVPMGFIAWKSMLDELGGHLTSWDTLTNTNDTEGGESFSISHAHPNVTTGGLLSLMAAILSAGGDPSDPQSVYLVRDAEKLTSGYGPTDLSLLEDLLYNGPDWAAGVIGFENTLISLKREGRLSESEQRWDDELAMLYFNETFWVTNPLCDLTQSSWIHSDIQMKLAKKFMSFALEPSRLNSSLIQNGIRPMQGSIDSSLLPSEIWNYQQNGVDPNITKSESLDWNNRLLNTVNATSVDELLGEWRNVKKPVFLHIVLDVTKRMLNNVNRLRSRWFYVQRHLVSLPERLEDRAIIHISCVGGDGDFLVKCSKNEDDYNRYGTSEMEGTMTDGFHPASNLTLTRDTIITLISQEIAPRASMKEYYPMQGLNLVIDQTNVYLNDDPSVNEDVYQEYNYRIVFISARMSGTSNSGRKNEMDTYDDLVNAKLIGYNQDPRSLSVFSMLYYDDVTRVTGVRLNNISTVTSGRFVGSNKGGLSNFLDRFLYYV